MYDERCFFLTVSGHAEREALLQPAELAPVPVDPVHHAVLLARALVVDHGALAAAEEALAALARDDAVVHPARLVAAHLARDDLDLGCNRKRGGRFEKSCETTVSILTVKFTPLDVTTQFGFPS